MSVVLFIMVCKACLGEWIKSQSVTIEMKATKQFSCAVAFIIMYNQACSSF